MQKHTKLAQPLLIAGCAGMIFASTGCRSAMPKWNLFSWRSTPSAETLAGNGPSITYPAPPGESATPDAIASYAGGTAERPENYAVAAASANSDLPVTGFDATAGSVSRAAAQANGFNLASNRTPGTAMASAATPSTASPSTATTSLPGYTAASLKQTGNNSSIPAVPTGYKFGAKSSPSAPASGSRYSMPSSYPAPGAPSGGTSPATGYSLPTGAPSSAPSTFSPGSASLGQPQAPSAGATTPNGGFAMPDSMIQTVKDAANGASNSKPFTPKLPMSATNTGADSMTMSVPSAGLSLPGNASSDVAGTKPAGQTPATTVSTGSTTPSFSTASASLSPRTSSGSSSNGTSGYAPGSTAGASSYPTTSGFPSTGTDGSFYR